MFPGEREGPNGLLDVRFSLRIDGVLCSLAVAGVLYQKQPAPGEHKWSLRFDGPGADRLLDAAPGQHCPPTDEVARRVLASLEVLLQLSPREGVLYLLNSVELLEAKRGRVRLFGACSPIAQPDRPVSP